MGYLFSVKTLHYCIRSEMHFVPQSAKYFLKDKFNQQILIFHKRRIVFATNICYDRNSVYFCLENNRSANKKSFLFIYDKNTCDRRQWFRG